jgi:hypothetical protein
MPDIPPGNVARIEVSVVRDPEKQVDGVEASG